MEVSVAVLVGASVLLVAVAAVSSWVPGTNLGSRDGMGQGWRGWLIRMGSSRMATRVSTTLLERRIELAGRPVPIEYVVGMKVALAFGTASVFVLAAPLTRASLLVTPIAAGAAFCLPDIAFAKKARLRVALMSDQVSELADIVLVMTEAGLSPAVAFRRAAEVLPDPLGSELGEVIRRLDLGIPWRSAITEVAERSTVKPLKRLARALTRAQRLGTSLASVLRTMAGDLRAERRAQAEMAARQAPVKMLFPLVFLILPAFLLLTGGPVVLSTIRSL
ncbi:MAG: type II secretion system F family protein [Actinomycetota bacterium]|nr:type II secretion system F family protein [Actinomycetota bacterium]